MKKILKYAIAFVLIIIVFNVLLFFSSLFPSAWIEENVKESSKILMREGNLFYVSRFFSVKNNNYTDSIMINESYSIDNKNPFFSYMSGRKNYKTGLTVEEREDVKGELESINPDKNSEDSVRYDPVDELEEFLDGKVTTSIEYARYWHGYLVVLRVLLLFYNISGIRYFLFGLFLAFFIILLKLLKEELGYGVAIIFGFALIIEDYFFVSYSLESAPIFITMMISSIILLIKLPNIKDFYLYLFIVACISNFVDFLTVPLITLAIPLYIYLLYKQKNSDLTLKESIITIIKSSIAWGCGYAITWISKWVLFDIIFNKNLISSAISQVVYRSVTDNPLTSYTIGFVLFNFILKNIMHIIFFLILGSLVLIILGLRHYKIKFMFKEFPKYLKGIVPYIIISIFPFVWYTVLMNHTTLHTHFVYRHMLIFLLGILICLIKIIKDVRTER